MNKAIYFDMDGTIANLYGVDDWLNHLINESTKPYAEAKPMLRLSALARILNNLQRKGWTIGVVSWLAKNGSTEYNKKVVETKRKWLETHLASVEWNEIHIVEYGTPKEAVVNEPKGILFDDEKPNREKWLGVAYDEKNILNTLKAIA